MTTNTPSTVLDWLVLQYPEAKKTTLRDMVERKRVLLNGEPAKSLKQTVAAQDKLEVGDPQGPTGKIAEGLKIVYQDADILIVDKPAGLLTSTHDDEPRPTALAILLDYVRDTNQKAQALLVHRLDRDASGLLVFARNATAFKKLKEQFAAHDLDRQYTVLVHGVFRKPTGRLENLLYEDDRGLVHATKQDKRAKPAIMDYEVVSSSANITRLKCTLFTGRKHQIRVQLKAVGHPVLGDPVYGTRAAMENQEPPNRMALHASHLGFKHPKTGKKVAFESAAPSSFDKIVAP